MRDIQKHKFINTAAKILLFSKYETMISITLKTFSNKAI